MNKKKLQIGLIFAILFVAYNIVLFLLNNNYQISFWISFGFIVVSFVLTMVAFFFVSDEKRKKQVVGMPVTVLTVMYFVVEFVLGTILMIFSSLSFAAVFVPQFVLFVLFLLCFVPAMLSENNYKQNNPTSENKKEEDIQKN